jgi:hypothetical protein
MAYLTLMQHQAPKSQRRLYSVFKVFYMNPTSPQFPRRSNGMSAKTHVFALSLTQTRNAFPVQYWQQSVKLTGLGSPVFQEYMEKMLEIEDMFARELPSDTLISPPAISFNNYYAIRTTNRFLTPRQEQDSQPQLPISSTIDPFRLLARVPQESFVHLPVNQVEYLEAKLELDGKF